MFSLTDWEFTKYVVTPVIHCLQIRTTAWESEFAPRSLKLARAANLFKVLPTPSQGGKLENLCRNYFILKSRAA